RLVSENGFRSRLGLKGAPASDRQYTEDQVVKHTGLNSAQLGTLALFDVLVPVDGRDSYVDLVTARAAGQLFSSGVVFPKIIAAALALEGQGKRLSNVGWPEPPWAP